MPHGEVLMTLSVVLRIKRTLDGREIDEIISDVVTRKAMAVEKARRRRWQRALEQADAFRETMISRGNEVGAGLS